AAAWLIGVPKPSRLTYLKTAGEWIAANVPADARLLTNDSRIAYFSGRAYREQTRLWTEASAPLPDPELKKFEYFALVSPAANEFPQPIPRVPDARLVRSFPGGEGQVLIYKNDHAN